MCTCEHRAVSNCASKKSRSEQEPYLKVAVSWPPSAAHVHAHGAIYDVDGLGEAAGVLECAGEAGLAAAAVAEQEQAHLLHLHPALRPGGLNSRSCFAPSLP